MLANVCAGLISSCYGELWDWHFWGFWASLQCFVRMRVLALLVYLLLCTVLGSHRCASCWTRPLGGGRWRHYLCNLWGDCLAAHKTAFKFFGVQVKFWMWKSCMLALVGQPSLHGYYACMVCCKMGHFGEIAGKSMVRPLFSLPGFFCVVGILMLVLRFSMSGVWFTHGDLALEANVDFLAVVGHRLIPARVRSKYLGSSLPGFTPCC